MIGKSDVIAAADTIAGRVRRTPIIEHDGLVLKLELLQHTGSFKPRGTFNKVLQSDVGAAGLIAASGGNHGLAVAYAAHQLGVPAEIFVPTISSPVKVARLASMGAKVNVGGAVYAEALELATERQRVTRALSVHAYDDPLVVAGQGTVGLELCEQAPYLDTVLVAVGGGGLAGGIAACYGSAVQVVAVETTDTNAYAAAREVGRPVEIDPISGPAADSLGASSIGPIAFEILAATDIASIVVDDEAVVAAQQMFWNEFRLVVEPGGATAMAAVISGLYQPSPDERVGVVVCGSNADPASVVSTPAGSAQREQVG